MATSTYASALFAAAFLPSSLHSAVSTSRLRSPRIALRQPSASFARHLGAALSSESEAAPLAGGLAAATILLVVATRAARAPRRRSLRQQRRRRRRLGVSRHYGLVEAGPPADEETDRAELGEWCALVINLARREDRLERLGSLLSAGNPRLWQRLERVNAVDGRELKLDDEAVAEVVDEATLARATRAKKLGLYTIVHEEGILVHFDDHMTEGGIACAMSHRKALERIASHPTAEWGLVLEDDVSIAVPNIDRAIARLLRALPHEWNAVFLGYHHEDARPHPFGCAAADPIEIDAEVAGARAFEIHDHSWGLYGWMVKKDAAKDLVDNLFPISSQVDYAISRWLVLNRRGVYAVHPEDLLLYSPTSEKGQDSDIQSMIDQEALVDEHGSLQAYKQQLKPDEYADYDLDDLYAFSGAADCEAPDAVWDSDDWESDEEAEAEELDAQRADALRDVLQQGRVLGAELDK